MVNYIYVFDEELQLELLKRGCTLMQQASDINGVQFWTLCLNGITFDIDDESLKGKCCLTPDFRLTF